MVLKEQCKVKTRAVICCVRVAAFYIIKSCSALPRYKNNYVHLCEKIMSLLDRTRYGKAVNFSMNKDLGS